MQIYVHSFPSKWVASATSVKRPPKPGIAGKLPMTPLNSFGPSAIPNCVPLSATALFRRLMILTRLNNLPLLKTRHSDHTIASVAISRIQSSPHKTENQATQPWTPRSLIPPSLRSQRKLQSMDG